MKYCPGCQEPLKEDQQKCLYCGYEVIVTKNEEPEPFANNNNYSKLFYKRAVFLAPLISVLIVAILAVSGFAVNRYYQEKQKLEFKKELKATWLGIINRSKQIDSSLELVTQPTDLNSLKEDYSKFSEYLASKQVEAVNLEGPEKFDNTKANLVDTIDKYSKYIYLLKLVLQKDIGQVKMADYSKIEKSSVAAREASEKFVAETPFVDENLQGDIFKAIEKIKPLIEKVQKQNIAQQEREKKQKQSTDKRAVEKTVRSFMQAKIDKGASEMRRYITPAYDKVFDPEQEFAVTDTYSIDFKITKTEIKSDKVFEISGIESGKDLTGEKFTSDWWFKVIKYEGDWLIDNRRLIE